MNYVIQPNGIPIQNGAFRLVNQPIFQTQQTQQIQQQIPQYLHAHPVHQLISSPHAQPVVFNSDMKGSTLPVQHETPQAKGLFIAKAELDPLLFQIKTVLNKIESLATKS